jgi:hypothetical protein
MKNRIFALTFVAGMSIGNSAVAQTPAAPVAPEAAQRRPADAPGTTPTPAAEAQSPTAPAAPVTDPAPAPDSGDATLTSTPGSKALGISILGNQEAPTSLVIVPWKSSELGNSLGNSPLLDDSRQPVDKDVFMRALRYYEIRSEPAGHSGMTTGGRENAAAEGSATPPPAARRR